MEQYGNAKKEWLKQFLELPNGIPSHDTISRVFARLDPKEFEQCFRDWVKTISELIPGEVISIDGKTVKHSGSKTKNQKPIHVVNAWACEQRLVLGQIKVKNKSNEITAIPELIKVLELSGCLVTIDAMGTQTKIAQLIQDRGADYCLALKKIITIFVKGWFTYLTKLRRLIGRRWNMIPIELSIKVMGERKSVVIGQCQ